MSLGFFVKNLFLSSLFFTRALISRTRNTYIHNKIHIAMSSVSFRPTAAAAPASVVKNNNSINAQSRRRCFTGIRGNVRNRILPLVKASSSNDDQDRENDSIQYTDDLEFFENIEISPFLRPSGSPILASTTDPTVWKNMQKVLRDAKVEQIMPKKAKDLIDNHGWTLVDVRPQVDWCAKHAYPSKNCQYFVPLEVTDLSSFGKQALSLAIFPERIRAAYANVSENEAFVDEVVEEGLWGEKVILYDDIGGVIGEEKMNFADGVQTPSLMAAHELIARGFGSENVKHMAAGLEWWDEVEDFDIGSAEQMPLGM